MSYGVTTEGFVRKTLDQIKTEMQASLRNGLGNSINLLETELLGQIVGILAEQHALDWELMEGVYNSFYPATASGISLDNVVSITGIQRLNATKGTGSGIAYGTLGTVIPSGSIVSVDGDSTVRFITTADFTIAAGTDEVQTIEFSSVPDAGEWTLIFDGEETGTLLYNDTNSTVETALNALSNLSDVTVTGDYTSGFTVTFAGTDGSIDQPLLQIGTNTLTTASITVNTEFTEVTAGVLPNVTCTLEAETAGEINAYANTLTVIETPISGWDSFNNPSDIDPGTDTETDAALRLRRDQTLATAGASTVDSIRARLLEIEEVTEARVFENDDDVTDAYGRPAHSIECVVQDGADQDIVDSIWATKAAGIQTYGSESGTAADSMGFNHTVYFSRPTEIDIYVIVNLTVDADVYPTGGDSAVAQAIVDYANENFNIGDDVIYTKLYAPIHEIEGILQVELFIGTSPSPVGTSNITIADDEVSVFDTANITVSV